VLEANTVCIFIILVLDLLLVGTRNTTKLGLADGGCAKAHHEIKDNPNLS
jgi:hypothetical protein